MSVRGLITIAWALFTLLVHALPPQQLGSENLDRRHETSPNIIAQSPVQLFLALLSRPVSEKSPFEASTYYLDKSAGEGSVVYLIDSGFDTTTEAYRSLHPEPRWIIHDDMFPLGESKEKDDVSGHGTCMGSIITSVARNVSLVIVKVPIFAKPPGKESPFHMSHFIATLWAVVEDMEASIKDNPDLRGRLFVNFSAGWSLKASAHYTPRNTESIKSAFKAMDKLAMIYAAVGNRRIRSAQSRRDDQPVDFEADAEYPERWRDDLPHATWVGMADHDGRRSRGSKNPSAGTRALWAVAEKIQCAARTVDLPRDGGRVQARSGRGIERTGTSLATPQAVALAAYAVALPHKPFTLPDPRDFDGYVKKLHEILESSSSKWTGGKEKNEDLLVPLISNRFGEKDEDESNQVCEDEDDSNRVSESEDDSNQVCENEDHSNRVCDDDNPNQCCEDEDDVSCRASCFCM